MRKNKLYILLILCLALIITGCANGKYLKTSPTGLNVANFYSSSYISSFAQFQNVDATNTISSETDKIAFANYMLTYYQVMPEERCFISALDYICGLNENSETLRIDPNTKVKLYEYSSVLKNELAVYKKTESKANNYANTKAVVVVKSAKNDAEFTSYLFYKNSDEQINLATLLNNLDTADYKYIFTMNKYNIQTKTYTITYGKNETKTGCEATAIFNTEKGYLSYKLKTFLGDANSLVNFDKNIYRYAGDVIGLRAVSNYKSNSKTLSIVYEQLSKSFYNKLKLGEIKSASHMLSMETMQEDRMAKVNSSDLVGFELELNTQNDEIENKIICNKYGTTN